MASNSSNTWLFDFTDVLVNKKYMCTHKIGSGGFGVVYHAVDYIASLSTSTPPEFAIKIMAKWDPNSENMPDPGTPLVESTLRKQQKWEMSTHNIVSDHPNIVTLHESFEDYRFIYMVMDYCSGPDLFGLATEFSFWRDDTRCKTMFLQILDAVEACHNLGVYHRDIKPENVLSSKDGKHYYLADFGLAISSPPANLKPSCGTFSYMSPECLGEELCDEDYCPQKADIWALGVMLLEVISVSRAWYYPSLKDPFFIRFVNKRDFLCQAFPISASAQELIRAMLKLKPSSRPSIQTIRELVQELDTFWMTDEELDGPQGTESNRTIAERCNDKTRGFFDCPAPTKPQDLVDQPLQKILSAFNDARISCRSVSNHRSPIITQDPAACQTPLIPTTVLRHYQWNRPWDISGEFVIGSVSSALSSGGPITPETFPTHPVVRVDSIELSDIEFVNRFDDEDPDTHLPAISASKKGKLYVRDFRKLAEARNQIVTLESEVV